MGGRLLKDLEDAGHRVVCLTRRPELLRGRAGPETTVVASDLSDHTTLMEALRGATAACDPVHAADVELGGPLAQARVGRVAHDGHEHPMPRSPTCPSRFSAGAKEADFRLLHDGLR